MRRLLIVLGIFVAVSFGLYYSMNRSHILSKSENLTEILQSDKVYLFTKKGCPYCSQAISYIKQNHPDFQIEILDVLENETNRNMAIACANRFAIPLNHLGTPLICMPDDFILGWGGDAPRHFDDYVKKSSIQGK